MKHYEEVRGVIIYEFVDHKQLRKFLEIEGVRDYVIDFVKPHATMIMVDKENYVSLYEALEKYKYNYQPIWY